MSVILLEPSLKCLYRFELNYNEGWNVIQAARAFSASPFYANDPLHVVNYPPVSFYLIRSLSLVTGDLLFAGRAVAYTSMMAVAISCFWIGLRLYGYQSGMIAAFLWLGLLASIAPGYVGIDDPQMLGHAFMIAGLALYISRGRSNPSVLVLVALLLSLGTFVKQNLICVPLAISIDLLLHSRREFLFWCIAGLVWAGILLILTYVLAGGTFLTEVLSPRPYAPVRAFWGTLYVLEKVQIPFFAAAAWLLITRSRCRRLIAAYLVLAAVTGALLSGGDGISWNAFFDFLIALALGSGLLVGEVCHGSAIPKSFARWWPALALAISFPLTLQVPGSMWYLDEHLKHLLRLSLSFRGDVEYLRSKSGPAVCESLLLCYYAGKNSFFEPYNERRLVLQGGFDEVSLLQKVQNGEIAVVQYTVFPRERPQSWTAERFTEAFLDTVRQRYQVERTSLSAEFSVPRSR